MFVVEGKVERRQFLHSPNNDDEFFTTKQDTQVLYRHTHTHTSAIQTHTYTQRTYTDTESTYAQTYTKKKHTNK